MLGLSIATSAIGAVGGMLSGRRAEREQRRWINRALGQFDEQERLLEAGYGAARPMLNQLLELGADAVNDNLAQVDPITAAEIRRQRRERLETEARLNSEMVARGLDSTTTRLGAQASVSGAAMDARAELGARMAAQRMAALNAGRAQEAAALGAGVNFETSRGAALGSVAANRAQLMGGVQVVQPNTAANIGALGRGIIDAYRTSVLDEALKRSAPGQQGVPWGDVAQSLFS